MENKRVYIDFESSRLMTEAGAFLTYFPSLSYYACPKWEVHITDSNNEGVDLSEAVSWSAAVDVDFRHSTEPMVRTLPADIDSSRAEQGIITVPLDTRTAQFFSKVDNADSVNAYFELRGKSSEDKVIYDFRVRIYALGVIDAEGGEPLPLESGGVTMSDMYALLRAALEYSFSQDGSSWHSTQQSTDRYYRTRYPEGEWGQAIEMQRGYNVQTKYSAASSGPWHNDPASSDFYFSMSNDDGSTWTSGILFRGTDGIGFNLLGNYYAGVTYHPLSSANAYECVYHNGSTYAYIADEESSGNEPPASSYWQCIASGQITYTDATIDSFSSNPVANSAIFEALDDKLGKPSGGTSGQFLMYDGTSGVWATVQGGGGADYDAEIDFLSGAIDGADDRIDEVSGKLAIGYQASTIAVDASAGDYAKISIAGNLGTSTLTISNLNNGDALAIEVEKLSGTTVQYGSTEVVPSGAGHFLLGVLKVNNTVKITTPTELKVY